MVALTSSTLASQSQGQIALLDCVGGSRSNHVCAQGPSSPTSRSGCFGFPIDANVDSEYVPKFLVQVGPKGQSRKFSNCKGIPKSADFRAAMIS